MSLPRLHMSIPAFILQEKMLICRLHAAGEPRTCHWLDRHVSRDEACTFLPGAFRRRIWQSPEVGHPAWMYTGCHSG